jgi:energy-coupling factor transport system ATP-binding protein
VENQVRNTGKDLLVEIRNLSFAYKESLPPVLEDLSFRIHAGEYVAVLGANGSGKSTLLGCVNGLNLPPPGTVLVYDRDGAVLDPAGGSDGILDRIRRIVGTVMQNPDDQIVSSVAEEDMAFGLENLGFPEEEIRVRVDRVLKALGLEELRTRPPQFLSGGERQRLALAGVLVMENEVIALDEAASMIDPAGRETLLALLDSLIAGGKTVLHITHSLDEAFRCRRCLVLHRGRLVFDGPPGVLLNTPELAGWGFRLPESAKTIRSLSQVLPGFSVSSLESGETAEAVLRAARDRNSRTERDRSFQTERDGAASPPTPSPEASPGTLSVPREDSGTAPRGCPVPAETAVLFDSVFHEYLRGTAFAAPGISGVSCRIPRNRSVILIGTSGSGKSTVLKHINALLLPAPGRVVVLGEDTLDKKTDLRSLRRRAALAVQSPESALFEPYVADDVAYGPRNAGLAGAALVNRVKNAMAEMGLPYEAFADRETGTLSGGEKRRAAIAGVLALDSEILLLDEPAAALDGRGREQILALVKNLREAGKTIIATTHSMEMAAAFDLVGVMVEGRVAALAPPREIFGPRWDPAWGMRLPWTVTVARRLADGGLIPREAVPLNAEELTSLILRLPGAEGPLTPVPASPGEAPRPAPGLAGGPDPNAAPGSRRRRRKTGVEFFRNVTFGQFLDRASPLRRLGAGKKLCLLLASAAAVIAGPGPFFPPGILLLTLLGGGFAGRVGPKHLLRGLIPALPYIGLIAFFQLFFSWPQDLSRVLISLGSVSVTLAELSRVLLLLCRLMALMALVSLYSAVTPLRESLKAINRVLAPFSKIGAPVRDITLAIGIALRFVPLLTEEAERIVTAQFSRGSGKGRIRTALSMVVPLLLRALERSETLAKAMTLRLYPSGKKRQDPRFTKR